MQEIKLHLLGLENQIDEIHLLYKAGREFPDDKLGIIDSKFNFYETDLNIEKYASADTRDHLFSIKKKIDLILENDEVIKSVVDYVFSFVDLWGDQVKIKADFIKKVQLYKRKIES